METFEHKAIIRNISNKRATLEYLDGSGRFIEEIGKLKGILNFKDGDLVMLIIVKKDNQYSYMIDNV